MEEIIYLIEERRYGYLLSRGAHMSLVRFTDDFNNDVETYIENDEWEEPYIYEQE